MCNLCVDIRFQLFGVPTKEYNCWIVWYEYVYFCKKPPNCLLKWLYHFAFPPTMNGSSCCSKSSPGFDVSVKDSGVSDRCVVISHCLNFISLMTYDMEHVFICFFC